MICFPFEIFVIEKNLNQEIHKNLVNQNDGLIEFLEENGYIIYTHWARDYVAYHPEYLKQLKEKNSPFFVEANLFIEKN